MRKLDLYWKSNRDWWFYDENFIPRLRITAPPDAQKSFVRYKIAKGQAICNSCPRIKEFIDIGKCHCGADHLKMNVKTHLAVCDFCGSDFGIPLAIPGLCYNDVLFNHYEFTFNGDLSKDTILAASKILGTNATQLYKAIKDAVPVKQDLTYRQSLAMKELISPLGIPFTISPELIEYEKYEECWGHSEKK